MELKKIVRVFVSSPFHELKEERKAIQRALNRMSLNAVAMEHFGSFPDAPIDRCINLVKTTDFFVMLLGSNLGTMVRGSSRTYTEEEYCAALENSIPVLAYFKTGGPFPEVDAFREAIAERHGYSFFTSPDDLSWKVISDLARELMFSASNRDSEDNDPDVFMFKRFKQEKEVLIKRLNDRAAMVRIYFQSDNRQNTAEILKVFRKLHEAHIELIINGNFSQAHETLRDIYDLLKTAAKVYGFEDPGHMYQLSFPTIVQRFVQSNYLAGIDNTPPSSPFSTFRLYEHVLSSSSRPTVQLPLDTLYEEK